MIHVKTRGSNRFENKQGPILLTKNSIKFHNKRERQRHLRKCLKISQNLITIPINRCIFGIIS